MTKFNLLISSWNYRCANWVYVVLSRVKTLKGLVLCAELDGESFESIDEDLDRFEEKMRKIEKRLFEQRDEVEAYLDNYETYA